MNKLKVIMLFSIFLLVSTQVNALTTIDINVKPAFYINETIKFDYTITSDTAQRINYVASVKCPNAQESLLELKMAELEANVPYTDSYSYITIDESIEPQSCMAQVSIIEPYNVIKAEKFNIMVEPSFFFDIKIDKKIFIKNEDIHLDYSSEVENPLIYTIVKYPDGKTKSVDLPTSIKADQIGTYELEVIASKPGYKTVTKKIQFGVIEKQAEIKEKAFIGKKEKEEKVKEKPMIILIIILSVALIAIIILIIYLVKRKSGRAKQNCRRSYRA